MDIDYSTTDDDSTQFMEPTVTSIIADVDADVREATRLVATGEVDLGTVVVDIDEAWRERWPSSFCCNETVKRNGGSVPFLLVHLSVLTCPPLRIPFLLVHDLSFLPFCHSILKTLARRGRNERRRRCLTQTT